MEKRKRMKLTKYEFVLYFYGISIILFGGFMIYKIISALN